MLKALVLKELRESAGLLAVALFAAVLVLSEMTGFVLLPFQSGAGSQFPFVADAFTFYFCLLAGGLAILLGFKQSAWELWQGSYFFLLHRPASRQMIFGAKLAVGLVALLLITGLLIQTYAWWAATPGKHASPFLWPMTSGAWQLWISFPVVYLGAFLSGIRPGKWFGSRLLPLATSCAIAFISALVPWWWLGWSVAILASATLVIAIRYYVVQRDY